MINQNLRYNCCIVEPRMEIQRNRLETITKPTVREVMEEFTRIPLIDGKTFWELENELEWV